MYCVLIWSLRSINSFEFFDLEEDGGWKIRLIGNFQAILDEVNGLV